MCDLKGRVHNNRVRLDKWSDDMEVQGLCPLQQSQLLKTSQTIHCTYFGPGDKEEK